MDARTLATCTGATLARAQQFAWPIEDAMSEFGIESRLAKAAFLANVGHESGGLKWLTELWGPTEAQKRYEGRRDLGNTHPGDGAKFKGRGLLQTTGRSNYQALSNHLGVDFVSDPAALAEPVNASRSAGYFWKAHNLNAPAEVGDFVRVVKIINGGTNGLSERQALYQAALGVLS